MLNRVKRTSRRQRTQSTGTIYGCITYTSIYTLDSAITYSYLRNHCVYLFQCCCFFFFWITELCGRLKCTVQWYSSALYIVSLDVGLCARIVLCHFPIWLFLSKLARTSVHLYTTYLSRVHRLENRLPLMPRRWWIVIISFADSSPFSLGYPYLR